MLFLLSAYLYKYHFKPRKARLILFLIRYFPWLGLRPVAANTQPAAPLL